MQIKSLKKKDINENVLVLIDFFFTDFCISFDGLVNGIYTQQVIPFIFHKSTFVIYEITDSSLWESVENIVNDISVL